MNSGFGTMNLSDLLKSAVNAGVVAIVIAVAGAFGNGLDVFHADWMAIVNVIVNAGLGAFFGDLLRRLGTTEEGKFMGVIKL